MKRALSLFLAGSLGLALSAGAGESRILIYPKNNKGFIHDNIPACVAALQKAAVENGFTAEVSTNASVFTDENLKKYKVLVFANSNNEAFDTQAQKDAFMRYIRGGGGFVGIHSACGSERAWPWYWAMLGGTFAWHPALQKFTITIVDHNHPATACLPGNTWAWEDEFYALKEMPADLHILLTGDMKKLQLSKKQKALVDTLPSPMPLAWYHEFEGGRCFYTALGHKKEHYSDKQFMNHILGGILWAAGSDKKPKTEEEIAK